MNSNLITSGDHWYQSYEMAASTTNEKGESEITFEVSVKGKEFIENNENGIKEILEEKLDAYVTSIEFEDCWNGYEECYLCTVTYDGYDKAIDELIEADDLKNEDGNGYCEMWELSDIAEDYPEKIDDAYSEEDKEYSVADDIIAKLGENYTCFYTEGNMYFWDKTKWTFDSAELNFKAL